MKKSWRLTLCGWLALGLLASAQPDPEQNSDYRLAIDALSQGRMIAARRVADKRLAANPEDLVGLYLMSQLLNEEGVGPRTYLYAGKALDELAKLFKSGAPISEGHKRFHQQLLVTQLGAASEMGNYEAALELIATHDKLYEPKLESQAGWPLLKLGRTEELKKRMGKLAQKGGPDEQITALNTLAALSWQNNDAKASRDYIARISEISAQSGFGMDPTILCNKAEFEVSMGNFEVAERDYLEAGQNFSSYSASNPYQYLAMLYVDSGQFSKAIDASRKMHAWAKMSVPAVSNQNWASKRKQFASVLLAAGYAEQALPILSELLHRPERNATTSDKPYRLEAEVLLLYQDCLDITLGKVAEQASWSPLSSRLWAWAANWSNRSDYADAQQRVASLIVGHDALAQSLYPYLTDWVAPPWLIPDLNEAVGPGVLSVQVQQMEPAADPYIKPYLQAYLGEAKMRQGDYTEALPLLETAEGALSHQQVLLKSRVRLCLAVCKEKTGDIEGALQAYAEVIKVDPNMFRRLNLGLPTKFDTEESEVAQEAQEMLESSPRFRQQDYGFTVELASGDGKLQARLLDPDGKALVFASGDEDPELTPASRTCRQFHEAVFAPRIKLSASDIAGIQNAGPEEIGL